VDKKTARVRWAVLLGALAVTVSAICYPVPPDDMVEAVSRPARAPKTSMISTVADSTVPTSMPEADPDPFASRGWVAPPPAPVQQQVVTVNTQPAEPLAPPGPPPLPFRFVGRMNDEGQQVVYLSRGDQAIVARGGETLEGTYKVLNIEPQRIEFEHIPTGEKQVLALPATDN